jgi:hypothetical protein
MAKIVTGFVALVAFLIILLGLVIKPAPDGDPFSAGNLWEALHPASSVNIIGLVMVLQVLIVFSPLLGIVLKLWAKYVTKEPNPETELYLPSGSVGVALISFFLGVLGVFLIFA